MKGESRSERLRAHAAEVETATMAIDAMGVVVRGRETRAWTLPEPPEVVFAATSVEGRALPAAVWVALRRDDVSGAVEAMSVASQTTFLVSSREEMGEGYKLQTIDETRPLPEAALLIAQLAAMLDIPPDVLAIIAEWGADDSRTHSEIAQLLDRRCGPAGALAPVPTPSGDGLTMTVAETADVLQLTEAQAKVLATLVHRVGVTITA